MAYIFRLLQTVCISRLPLSLVSREQVENSIECVRSGIRIDGENIFQCRYTRSGGRRKSIEKQIEYRLRDWLVGNKFKSPANEGQQGDGSRG